MDQMDSSTTDMFRQLQANSRLLADLSDGVYDAPNAQPLPLINEM